MKRVAPMLFTLCLALNAPASEIYDLVINGGRVMDPESGLDSVRNLGISGATVRAVTTASLTGRETIDGRGMVVAPGFINLHWHGTELQSDRYQVMDGVTSRRARKTVGGSFPITPVV